MTRGFLFVCALYLLALPFTKEVGWPEGLPMTLPELVFLLCLPAGLLLFFRSRPAPLRWLPLDTVLVALLGITIVTATVHPTAAAWQEVAIRGYLLLVYGLARLAIAVTRAPAPTVERGFRLLGGAAVGTVAISWLLWGAYDGAGLELAEPKYLPGRGTVWRMEAFTMSPNQLASLLSLCALVVLATLVDRREKEWPSRILLLLLVAALLSTFSKSLVLFAAAVFILLSIQLPLPTAARRLLRGSAVAMALFFVFTTSFLVLRKEAPDLESVLQQNYVTGETTALGPERLLAETVNIRLKKVAWQAFREHPFSGIGPGNFRQALPGYQERGSYPADKPLYDPHSSWFGSLAELGSVGLLAVGLLFGFLFREGRNGKEKGGGREAALRAALLVFFLQLAVDGWAMDVLNFRHFWVAMGVFVQLGRPAG